MTHSRTFRVLFVGSLLAASAGMVVFTGWLLSDEWRWQWSMHGLSVGIDEGNFNLIYHSIMEIEQIEKCDSTVTWLV